MKPRQDRQTLTVRPNRIGPQLRVEAHPTTVPKAVGTAPPVYRPQASAAPVQPKKLDFARPAVTAPTVYRPRQSAAAPVQPRLTSAAQGWRPGSAPPVYRPQSPAPALQPKIAANGLSTRPGAAPPAYCPNHSAVTRPAPSTALRAGTVQCVIVQGKTHRSKAVGNLKGTDWYKGLANDDEKAFAVLLHTELTAYTKPEAETEIEARINRGDPVPKHNVSVKDLRKKRVREYVNANAPDTSDVSYEQGNILAQAGERAYGRHFKKYKRSSDYTDSVKIVNNTKPGLFAEQKTILSDMNPWQQVVAVSRSQPQSFNFDLGGSEVTLDSIDFTSNDDREAKRARHNVNLNQFFIEQPNSDNSYWKIGDSTDRYLWRQPEHQQLRHLEVERDSKSAFTTYMKDDMFSRGRMTNQEAFGDEDRFTYQEYKGALNPTSAMSRMQRASAHYVLQKALTKANDKLGTRVKLHVQTSPKNISDALSNFMADKTEVKYKILVKEIYRLIRVKTRIDISSDSEPDSDADYA